MTIDVPVRVGLIGYGYAGRVFHAPLISASEGLALTAIGSSDAQKVHADWPDVAVDTPDAVITRDDIDLIVIATPNETHAPLARQALKSGKHVVIDKPFALDLDEARALIDDARHARRQLAVFHNRRWDSDFLSISAAIREQSMGELRHFESHFDRFRPQVRDRWRERDQPGGGIWHDLGPHLIDQTLCLFGLPDRIDARVRTSRPGGSASDWAHCLLEYPDLTVILHASMLVAGGSARFTLHGTRGSVVKQRLDQQEAQLLSGMTPGADGWGTDDDTPVLYDGEDAPKPLPTVPGDQRQFYLQIRDAIRGVGANPVPPIQALAVMAVLDAAITSSNAGCATRLSLTDAEIDAYQLSRRAAQ